MDSLRAVAIGPCTTATGSTATSTFFVKKFEAISNKTYSVRYLNGLNLTGPWPTLTNVLSRATNRVVDVFDVTPPARGRFYRVQTPMAP